MCKRDAALRTTAAPLDLRVTCVQAHYYSDGVLHTTGTVTTKGRAPEVLVGMLYGLIEGGDGVLQDSEGFLLSEEYGGRGLRSLGAGELLPV